MTTSTIAFDRSETEIGFQNAALLVAHPGHELRVHGWLERARPVCCVLTKGDGHSGMSRLASTTQILQDCGARTGAIYGRLDDAAIYAALRSRDFDVFFALLDDLVEMLIVQGIVTIVVDAEEGYNPSHDACRYLGGAAAVLTRRITGRPMHAFDFPLIGAPDTCPPHLQSGAVRLELDAAAFERKMRAAHHYPELQAEVSRALAANGAAAFRVECLRPAGERPEALESPPYYEEYGARQVAAGFYSEVITRQGHLLPLQEALWGRAATR